MKSVYRVILPLLLIFVCQLSAQTISQEELNKGQKEVEFINYSGPYYYTDTNDIIRNIGTTLARTMKGGGDKAFFSNKYKVLHLMDPTVKEGLDADIFIIEPDAPVDHINTLRMILASYLSEMYGYNTEQASLLARFVTLYNAVFRKDIAYLSTRYKAKVMAELTAQNAGLATYYKEWPGKSRIIIPLNFLKQLDSKLETIELSDQKVIDQLKQDNPQTNEDRKDLVDLQQQEIDKEQKAIDQKLADLKDDKSNDNSSNTDNSSSKDNQNKTPNTADDNVNDQDLTDRKDDLSQQQDKVDADRKDIASDESNRLNTQDDANSSNSNANTDSNANPASSKDGQAATPVLPVLKVTAGQLDTLSKMIVIDQSTGKLSKESELNSIQNRRYYVLSGGYAAIAGEKGGNRTIRLVLIDPAALKMTMQSEVDVFAYSEVLVDGTRLYAVSEVGGKNYLSVFDASTLKELARSELEVFSYTSMKISGTRLYIQGTDKEFVVLDKSSLKKL